MKPFLDRHLDSLALLLIVLLVAGGAFWLARPRDAGPLVIVHPAPTPTESNPKVYVSGAVVSPGVYAFAEGDRVAEAIQAAGGPTSEANMEAINLAVRLRDEQQIYVPKRNAESAAVAGTAEKLDLNSASAPELEALPGIGPVTAGKIIGYREENGPFESIEELKQAKLVTTSTYDRIKDLVVVR